MENSMEVLQKLKIDLPYDPATPLLSIYLKESDTIWTLVHPRYCSTIHDSQAVETVQMPYN
jgi:hypothetical protein